MLRSKVGYLGGLLPQRGIVFTQVILGSMFDYQRRASRGDDNHANKQAFGFCHAQELQRVHMQGGAPSRRPWEQLMHQGPPVGGTANPG